MKNGFSEVKIYDANGNLKDIISPDKLHKNYWERQQENKVSKSRRPAKSGNQYNKNRPKF